MKIKEIYEKAINLGIDADFRDNKQIENSQKRLKAKYDKLEKDEKEDFDIERLENPFSDSRILFGDPNKTIKKVLVGIDIGGEELFLAKEIKDIDLVISHHPTGKALAFLNDVMQLQVDVLNCYGVPVNVAEKLLQKRVAEVERGLSSGNHNRTVDIAKHLNVALMCLHTPCDNLAARFVEKEVNKDNPLTVDDVLKSLKKIPEYKEATKIGAGPKIFLGSKESRVGRIAIDMTGGTEGSHEIYEKLSQAGIGTVIGMHISEKHREEAEKANINVIIAGHISSDSIGVNLLLDHLEKNEIEIVSCSGLIRVSRN